jgi:hypothetical protein
MAEAEKCFEEKENREDRYKCAPKDIIDDKVSIA